MRVRKEDYRYSQHNYTQACLHIGHLELSLNRYLSAKANAKEMRGI